MDDRITDLLAVLDMTEAEQHRWTWDNTNRGIRESLADVAFRLRDIHLQNVSMLPWKALYLVYAHTHRVCLGCEEIGCKGCNKDAECWMSYHVQPIHWIIAALIAKELAKKGE